MEYFHLFDLPVQLDVDKKLLRQRYLELSRRFHPDYFAQANENEQANALQETARLNNALKVLGNREATIRYVLEQKGLLQPDEKYNLSPDFLMEMMDINEAVAELKFSPDAAQQRAIEQQLTGIENEIYEAVAPVVANYKEGDTSTEALLQVKDYYFRKKYLERLRQQLGGIS